MGNRVLIGALLASLVAFAPVSAHAITGVLCIKAVGKGAVKVRNTTCKPSEVQVGTFDTNTPQASLTQDLSVQVKTVTAISIPDDTDYPVPFGTGTEIYDTANFHDEVTDPTRLTAAVAGKYFVWAFATFAPGGGTGRLAAIVKNDTILITASNYAPSVGALTFMNVSAHVDLGAGDFVELWVYQNSGAPLSNGYPMTLGMVRVP